jgi:hypothetical protein
MTLVRRLFLTIAAVLCGLVVALALAEGAVRLFSPQEVGPVRFACDPELGEIPVPGQQGRRDLPGVFRFTYRNNSLGWRGGKEYREAKETDYRVLFLGDSFAYGIGVNDDQTVAARLEKDLQAEGLSVEVMNAGCPGKGTDYALKSFQTMGRTFHPDLTVLCVFSNDFQDNARGEYYNIDKQGRLQAKAVNCERSTVKNILDHLPGYSWLLSWSQAANLVKQAGVNLLVARARKEPPGAAQDLVVSYDKGSEGYANPANRELTRIYLENLNAAVRAAGGALMIAYIPSSEEVRDYQQKSAISPDERALQRLAADAGITLWSLTPLLAPPGQSISHFYYPEGHWTAAAHELAARSLSRPIHKRLAERRQPPASSRE